MLVSVVYTLLFSSPDRRGGGSCTEPPFQSISRTLDRLSFACDSPVKGPSLRALLICSLDSVVTPLLRGPPLMATTGCRAPFKGGGFDVVQKVGGYFKFFVGSHQFVAMYKVCIADSFVSYINKR